MQFGAWLKLEGLERARAVVGRAGAPIVQDFKVVYMSDNMTAGAAASRLVRSLVQGVWVPLVFLGSHPPQIGPLPLDSCSVRVFGRYLRPEYTL